MVNALLYPWNKLDVEIVYYRQWLCVKKAKPTESSGKVVAGAFLKSKGIILIDGLKKGKTIIS